MKKINLLILGLIVGIFPMLKEPVYAAMVVDPNLSNAPMGATTNPSDSNLSNLPTGSTLVNGMPYDPKLSNALMGMPQNGHMGNTMESHTNAQKTIEKLEAEKRMLEAKLHEASLKNQELEAQLKKAIEHPQEQEDVTKKASRAAVASIPAAPPAPPLPGAPPAPPLPTQTMVPSSPAVAPMTLGQSNNASSTDKGALPFLEQVRQRKTLKKTENAQAEPSEQTAPPIAQTTNVLNPAAHKTTGTSRGDLLSEIQNKKALKKTHTKNLESSQTTDKAKELSASKPTNSLTAEITKGRAGLKKATDKKPVNEKILKKEPPVNTHTHLQNALQKRRQHLKEENATPENTEEWET